MNEELETQETTATVEAQDAQDTTASQSKPELKTLEEVRQARLGKFSVGLTAADAKFFRNVLNKAEYKGSNEAYLLIMAHAELSATSQYLDEVVNQDKSKKESRHNVELTSATIEALNYFLERKHGAGAESARRLFTSTMVLRPVLNELQALDQKMQEFQKKEEEAK